MSSIEEKLKKMEVRFNQEEFVVIDNGTGYIKAGFSGQDLPRIVIPTVVGEKVEQQDPALVNQNATEEENQKRTYTYGNAAYANKDDHDIFEPIKRGIIEDWDNMTILWQHIFDELNLETKNVNVLLTDSPFNKKQNRVRMAEVMFEHFKVKSF